ncbi:hypothetical protein AOQ88_01765 [Candidatus Riesia sp. GBBU]|nr:hypothetical protein AOQ88_01765 [Candidatus Riesia sp. GBBU]
MTVFWPSPAKINLFLYIIGRRYDGFHNLQTLIQFLKYGDKIKIIPRKDRNIRLITPIPEVLLKENTIIKSASLLQSYCRYKYQGADIYIKKSIPIGSGLGGESSNAATILFALNYYWKTNLNDIQLIDISKKIGSEVSFFIKGFSSFISIDKSIPIKLKKKWYIIIYPKIKILTKKIFSDPDLKRNSKKYSLKELLNKPFKNDCEDLIKKKFPKIRKIILFLEKYKKPSITGTGSCIFLSFQNKLDANELFKKISKHLYCFITESTNISTLHSFRSDFLKE